MKALRFYGSGDLRLEEMSEPTAASGEVKIEVACCGVCGTDLHEYRAGPIVIRPVDRPHPLTGGHAPVTLGHEFAGTVVEVGDDVDSVAVGSKVAIQPIFRCERCPACSAGEFNQCVSFGALGLHADGAFAHYVTVPAYMVHPIPDGVSMDAAALAEPIAVGWHAVSRSKVRSGDSVLVSGAGPIGLGALIALKAVGASPVFVAEIGDSVRTRVARELGADVVIDPSVESTAERVLDLTDGRGVDVVIEAAGVQAALDAAMRAVRSGGTVVSCASWETPAVVDLNDLLIREITLVGTLAYTDEYPMVLRHLQATGSELAQLLVTKRVDVSDAIDGAFEELVRHKDQHVKILVTPD
jgi:(R,R)-butanediol dehydrogenase/meso-butanediol dehydrogenase/diacetyl reductase